jgi:hypothetical protein
MRITYGPRADVAVGALYDLSWSQFVEWLARIRDRSRKYPSPSIPPSPPRPPRAPRANGSPPQSRDRGCSGRVRRQPPPPIDEPTRMRRCARSRLQRMHGRTNRAHALRVRLRAYTTFGHTRSAPRWRVIVPTAGPLHAGTHRATWAALNSMFGNTADVSAKDISRLNYCPGPCVAPADAQFFASADGAYFGVVPAPPETAPSATTGKVRSRGGAGPTTTRN